MITVIKTPALFNPALNVNIWQIQSNRTDIQSFYVTVTDGVNIISKLQLYPNPSNRQGSAIDLQQILKNVVQTTIKKNDIIVQELIDVFSYRLEITEVIYNVTSNSTSLGESYTTPFYNVFNGQLPKITMSDYDFATLVATSASTPKFLTNKPASVTKYWTTEYLYYLNDGRATGVDIHLNYSTGTIVKPFPINPSFKSGRVNISPRGLVVNGVSLENLQSFTVNLVAGNTVASQTVTRYYNNLSSDCQDEVVNMIWSNDLGGIDSMLFKNPQETRKVDKVTIKTNPYSTNSAGFYTATDANIYQNNEVIISSDTTSEYTVVSDWLNNAESAWIPSIMSSKAVYVELTNGKLLPVKVLNDSATVYNSRYNKGLSQYTLQFQSESGLLTSIVDRINDASQVGMIGTTNPDIVLQTADYEYVIGLNGVVRV